MVALWLLLFGVTGCANAGKDGPAIQYPGQPEHCAVYESDVDHSCWMLVQGQPPKGVSCGTRCPTHD